MRLSILTEYNEKLHNKTLREEGIEQGMEMVKIVLKLYMKGKSDEEISQESGINLETVKNILERIMQ